MITHQEFKKEKNTVGKCQKEESKLNGKTDLNISRKNLPFDMMDADGNIVHADVSAADVDLTELYENRESVEKQNFDDTLSISAQKKLYGAPEKASMEMRKHAVTALKKIMGESGESSQFFELKRMAVAMLELKSNVGEDGEVNSEKYLACLMQLSQAAGGYMANYTNAFSRAGKYSWVYRWALPGYRESKYGYAKEILDYANSEISRYASMEKFGSEKKTLNLYDPAEKKRLMGNASKAVKSLKSLKKTYKFYLRNVDKSVLEGTEEKLDRKLGMFNSYKEAFETLDLIRQMNPKDKDLMKALKGLVRPGELSVIFSDLEKEYGRLRYEKELIKNEDISDKLNKGYNNRAVFKSKLKKVYDNDLTDMNFRSTKSALTEKSDETLLPAQISGIRQIDDWVLRNINNGGIIGAVSGSLKDDNSLIARELFSMTKRERLNVYYLIEKKKRKNFTGEDIYSAQVEYIPQVEEFKSQMISSKFFIMNRVTGDYIYWQKIGEAMRATRNVSKPIQIAGMTQKELDENIKRLRKDMKPNIGPTDEPVTMNWKISEAACETYLLFRREQDEPGNLKPEDFDKMREKVAKAREDLLKINPTAYNNSVGIQSMNIVSSASKYAMVPAFAYQVEKLNFLTRLISSVKLDCISGGGNALTYGIFALGTMISFGASASSMTWGEFFGGTVNVAKNAADAAYGAAMGVDYIKRGTDVAGQSASAMTKMFCAIGAGLKAGVGIVDLSRGAYQKHRASQMQTLINKSGMDKKSAEYRFADGMQKLSGSLASRRMISGGYMLLSGGLMAGSAVSLTLGAALSATLLSVSSTTGVDVVATILDGKKLVKLEDAAFDRFYELDEVHDEQIKAMNADRLKDNEPPLSAKEIAAVKDEIRRRVWQDRGFSSQNDAMTFIGTVYAKKIREVLVYPDVVDVNSTEVKIYLTLLKSLGLHYNKNRNKPTEKAIIAKFMGK